MRGAEMAEKPSESKEFEASNRKLRKMREKGQFAQSRDVITVGVTIAATVYMLFAISAIYLRLTDLFEITFDTIATGVPENLMNIVLVDILQVLWLVLPLFIVVLLVTLLVGGVLGGGISFSLEPLVPKFEKINPIDGFKRVFGRKALFQFLLSVIKLVVFLVILVGVIVYFFEDLLQIGTGIPVALDFMRFATLLLLSVTLGLMLVVAVFDYIIQRALFLEDARMTRTERKKETKDDEGEPLLRSRRREIALENVQLPVGARLATFAIQRGSTVVALRFDEIDTPVPVVVAKSKDPEGARSLRAMLPQKAPLIDSPLAAQIFGTPLGQRVKEDDLTDIARLMAMNGLFD